MSDYYILITDAGAALEASAHAAGTTVKLAKFGVCDGGVDFIPDPTATTFANEVFQSDISSLTISADDATVMVAQCIIPGGSGGYTIRGIAIYTDDDTLYATGNYPAQPKPAPDSGFAASLEILAQLAVSDTADVSLTVTEGNFLTETQGNTLYLRQDKRLSEIAAAGAEAQSAARDNLALGTAATHDAGDFLPSDYQPDLSGYLPLTGGELTGDLQVDGKITATGSVNTHGLYNSGVTQLAFATDPSATDMMIQNIGPAGFSYCSYGYYQDTFVVDFFDPVTGAWVQTPLQAFRSGDVHASGFFYEQGTNRLYSPLNPPPLPDVGAIGEVALVKLIGSDALLHGWTVAGSSLQYASLQSDGSGMDTDIVAEAGTALSGTWRLTGTFTGEAGAQYLTKISTAVRIA
ncbi:TPA: phage tail protein [Citrobacter braakii]